MNNSIEFISKLSEILNKAFDESNYIDYRCLATSSVMKYFLEMNGFECIYFTCEVKYFTKKLLDIKDKDLSKEEMHIERENGARMLMVLANTKHKLSHSIPEENQLLGHVALLIKSKDNEYFLCDSNTRPFNRTQTKHGCIIDIEDDFLLKVSEKEWNLAKEGKSDNSIIFNLDSGAALYDYCILDKFEELKNSTNQRDLNPLKAKKVIRKVKKQLKIQL